MTHILNLTLPRPGSPEPLSPRLSLSTREPSSKVRVQRLPQGYSPCSELIPLGGDHLSIPINPTIRARGLLLSTQGQREAKCSPQYPQTGLLPSTPRARPALPHSSLYTIILDPCPACCVTLGNPFTGTRLKTTLCILGGKGEIRWAWFSRTLAKGPLGSLGRPATIATLSESLMTGQPNSEPEVGVGGCRQPRLGDANTESVVWALNSPSQSHSA